MAIATIAEAKKAVCSNDRTHGTASAAVDSDICTNRYETLSVEASTTGGICRHKRHKSVQFTSPTLADYSSEAVGDEIDVLIMDTTKATNTPYTYEKYFKTSAGYEKVLTAGNSTSGASGGYCAYAETDKKVLDLRAIFSGNSGDSRVIYARGHYTGTGAQGESVRGYSHVMGTGATSVHGGHFTGQVSAGGTVTGQLCGARATLATDTGLTLTTGTGYVLRLDSDLASAWPSGSSAFIGVTDLRTSKVAYLIDTSLGVDSGTGTSHLLCYEADNMTFTCKGGFRIKTADGVFYIPVGTLAS